MRESDDNKCDVWRAQVPPGKTLVVKFADRAIASKAAATAAANYSSSAGPANGSFYM